MYAAWRLSVDAKAVPPSDLCLFEARQAVGGRTYSVEVGKGASSLVLDVGAYRFGKQQHLPGDLILERFNFSVVCYQPDCQPDPEFHEVLYRVVDAQGRNAGYSAPILRMLKDLVSAGVRIHYGYELTGIYAGETEGDGGSTSALHFAGGVVVGAKAVLLNLPRPALARLDPRSTVFPKDTRALSYQLLRNCTPCVNRAAGMPPHTSLAVKVYALYDDAWWLTKLGLKEGSFQSLDRSPPLIGRYHDGPVRRSAGGHGAPDGPGALEAVYAYSTQSPQISFYEPFAADVAADPLTRTSDPALVLPLHAHLMAFHAEAFAKVGLNATTDVPPPRELALGVWSTDPLAMLPEPLSANMHAMVHSPLCPVEPCIAGLTPHEYNAAVASPNPAVNVHVANNDFAWTGDQGVPCCWAEQSLKSVERTLHTAWALPRPEWLDADYYANLLVA